jgi:phospholipid transport system transporter-binding protein
VADKARIEPRGEGSFQLCGELSFANVPALLREGGDMFDGNGQVTLDLKEVTRSDSAGLALLVEWTRQARERDTQLIFRNISPQMLAIAQVSGLDRILSLGGH